MNPNPDEATAILTLGGIGVSCFTSGHPRKFQIAFVRQIEHELTLDICKEDLSTGKCLEINHDLDCGEGGRLFIEVHNHVYEECYWYQTGAGGPIDRFGTHDEHDYRWVVNMEDEIQKTDVKLKGREKDYKVTLLTVNNANFYTGSLFKYSVTKTSEDTAAREDFGRIADSVDADILCHDGNDSGVLVSNGPRGKGTFLPKERGFRYRITLLNIPKKDEGQGHQPRPQHEHQHGPHFKLLYGILCGADHKEYNLVSKTLVRYKNDPCNTGHLTRIDDLSSLL